MHTKKSDNQSLAEKLAIRKRICAEIQEPLRVLDLFAGTGRIWKAMAKHSPIASYTPVDQALKQEGVIRMKVTPHTVQAFNPTEFNVIDIDCYGDPFEIWHTVSRRIQTPTAIFLTFGHLGLGGTSCSYFLREQNGIPRDWPIPVDRPLNILLGRRYFMRSMAANGARLAVATDHPRVSYYGALVLGKGKIAENGAILGS